METFLIVGDAGGTKTSWWVKNKTTGAERYIDTTGINASISSDQGIISSVSYLRSFILRESPDSCMKQATVYFHGAGCASLESKKRVSHCFKSVFPDVEISFNCFSDLEGAALALFGDATGIACILGTGSSSCLYSGGSIIDSIPSLGYILGDEGSGAYLGKSLLNLVYKNRYNSLRQDFENWLGYDLNYILKLVYRGNEPNKFLASLVPFIKKKEKIDSVSFLIEEGLKLFFLKNVLKYRFKEGDSIRFVGGVASLFQDRITKIAASYGLNADKFLKNPIVGLAQYYNNKELYV